MFNFFRNLSLKYKITVTCAIACVFPLLLMGWLTHLNPAHLLLLVLIGTVISTFLANQLCKTLILGMRSLETGLLNFKDGELSTLLAYDSNDELGKLCQLYNQTAKQLRQEKQSIYQRELMLDKVLHSSPHALLLVNDKDIVVFGNLSSRDLFNKTTHLEGMQVSELVVQADTQLIDAMNLGVDGLFNLEIENKETQTWHLATGSFLLNNQNHRLYIFKQLTRELSRQEVTVWKKVIRIISHELNNSLGPMSSMLHSAQLLSKKVDEPRLERVFSTINERINHLTEFVQGYGKFAKLPVPKCSQINWYKTLTNLKSQWTFNFTVEEHLHETWADQAQLEQLLINLLKNAYESGSSVEKINIAIRFSLQHCVIKVTDNGKGMSEQVMANALVPFYSTKSSGTGLGLALCREIAEAHQGHISLHNQQTGGLCVQVNLPLHTTKPL
jgi:nitrogen fixation/metabolism regulation signal transduction histidine kinase